MEYINGKSLAQLKSEQPERFFEVDQIRPWIVQICEALDYAHQQVQIVHRDLKPANLMVDDKGVVKLMDFGISRSLVDSVSRLTNSTSGTLCYMSPQQATGKPPSPTDDLYALGATIYELLTGKPPFYTGHILMQLMNCIKMCPV